VIKLKSEWLIEGIEISAILNLWTSYEYGPDQGVMGLDSWRSQSKEFCQKGR
jgi:hypothetical protein